jgi:hypothetical protein
MIGSWQKMHGAVTPKAIREETYAICSHKQNKDTLVIEAALYRFNATARIESDKGNCIGDLLPLQRTLQFDIKLTVE